MMVGSASTRQPTAPRSQARRRATPRTHDAGRPGWVGAPAATGPPGSHASPRQQPLGRARTRAAFGRRAVVKDVGVRPPNAWAQ